jgi:hypothetical protein
LSQGFDGVYLLLGCFPDNPVHTRRVFAFIGDDSSYRPKFGVIRASQNATQGGNLVPAFLLYWFLLIIGSPNSFAKKHLMDVGALSCRILFQSVSASLQNGLRFFHPPKPAYLSARLAARFPAPQ